MGYSLHNRDANMEEKTPVLESRLEELRNIKDILKKN